MTGKPKMTEKLRMTGETGFYRKKILRRRAPQNDREDYQ